MERDYQINGIMFHSPKKLSEIFSEAEKELIYKKTWSKGISFNWEDDYLKPSMIKNFITELCYEPTPEVMGEVFCQAVMEEPRNPALYRYTNFELGKTKYLPLTKKAADILSYCVKATWNGEEASGVLNIKRLIEASDQLYLYREIEYRSLMHIGDELPKPEI